MGLPYLSPVVGVLDAKGMPSVAFGRFTLNGANDPTVIGGVVSSVRRLETGGAAPFFRVKLNATFPQVKDYVSTSMVFGIRPVDAANPRVAMEATDLITPSPADARGLDEFDVLVTDLAGAASDTAGTVVMFHISFRS